MMKGASVNVKPTDRSISPQISSSTSPVARMMYGAAIPDSRLAWLAWVKKFDESIVKYRNKATTTTRTVASRCRRKAPAPCLSVRKMPLPPAAWPPGGGPVTPVAASAVLLTSLFRSLRSRSACRRSERVPQPRNFSLRSRPVASNNGVPGPARTRRRRVRAYAPDRSGADRSGAGGGDRVVDRSGRQRDDLLGRGGALEPAGAGQVRADVGLGDEAQPGVGVGRGNQPAGQVVHVQVEGRQETLQVGVLVDGEVDRAGLDGAERHRGEVESAGRQAGQARPGQRLGEELGGSGVNRERALDALVAEQVGLLRRELNRGRRAGGDFAHRVAGRLQHGRGTVVARLDV